MASYCTSPPTEQVSIYSHPTPLLTQYITEQEHSVKSPQATHLANTRMYQRAKSSAGRPAAVKQQQPAGPAARSVEVVPVSCVGCRTARVSNCTWLRAHVRENMSHSQADVSLIIE